MAELISKNTGSSTTSKAALGFGVAGTALALMNGGANILGGINPIAPVRYAAPPVAPGAFYGGGAAVDLNIAPGGVYYHNGGYVTEKEMHIYRELDKSQNENAVLRSEKYTTEHVSAALAPVYFELKKQGDEICDLKTAYALETERRACGDERLLEYVNGNYIKAEKSINGRSINYHGCRPVITTDCCCCCNGAPVTTGGDAP
jgi:hypothetical protein